MINSDEYYRIRVHSYPSYQVLFTSGASCRAVKRVA